MQLHKKSMHFILAVGICLVATCAAERPIPDYLNICYKSDPELVGCMLRSIEKLRPLLTGGIKELGVPGIDPMDIGNLLVAEATRSNGLHISARNIRAFGASTFKIKNLQVIDYGKQYITEVFFPKLQVEGTYNVSGQILLLPIQGSGPFSGNFSECTGNVRMQFARNPENGLVQIKKFIIKIQVGKGRIKLHNLFNGDRTLGDALNSVINDNFDAVSRDIIPLVEKALQRLLKRITSRILENFTYSQIFPQ